MQIRISFRSRSDLDLDADHSLDSISYLVLQTCITLCSVSDKSGALLYYWEVGVGVDGVGVIFPIFYAFFLFFYAFFPFFCAFFPFFFAFLCFSERTRANNSNLLQKWGISLQPRLHRPRAKLPDTIRRFSEPKKAHSKEHVARSAA